MTCG
jgi:hypothetical protein